MIKHGEGWRIGWKDNAPVYKGLVGSDDWAIELTDTELEDFIRLLSQINQAVVDISQHLMAEEKIVCEVESELMWLGAEGYPDNYSLRIILSQHRCCEGTWPAHVIPSLILASQSLSSF